MLGSKQLSDTIISSLFLFKQGIISPVIKLYNTNLLNPFLSDPSDFNFENFPLFLTGILITDATHIPPYSPVSLCIRLYTTFILFTTYSEKDYEYIINDCKPKACIVSNNIQFKKIEKFISNETKVISIENFDKKIIKEISKITKIKLAMLNKDEYDPLSIHIGLPAIESFYDRRFKVLVTAKGEDYNFITHIQRPRDLEWEHIEMEYEGGFIKDPRKLYQQLSLDVLILDSIRLRMSF